MTAEANYDTMYGNILVWLGFGALKGFMHPLGAEGEHSMEIKECQPYFFTLYPQFSPHC